MHLNAPPDGSRKWNAATLFVLLLLFSAAFKDDTDAIANNQNWSGLAIPNWLNDIKSNSEVLLIIAGIIGLSISLRKISFRFRIGYPALSLLTLSFFSVIRTIQDHPDSTLKLSTSFLLILFIFYVCGRISTQSGVESLKKVVINAITHFSIIFILINGAIYGLGYGYVPQNPRYFGSSIHPNFVGTQLAICNIFITSKIIDLFNKKQVGVLLVIILLLGLWLTLASGSRTALAILVTGISTLIITSNKFKLKWWMTAIIILLIPLALYIANKSELEIAFYRGENGSDTRTAAWLSMIQEISEHPWLGYGYFSGQSENSYLRAMNAFGIPYGALLIGIVFFCIGKLLIQSLRDSRLPSSPQHLLLATFIAISIGGIFEGYLVDAWSLQKLIFVLVLAMLHKGSRRGNQNPAF